jgi:chloramphenicol-sensitive protein RarD
MFAGAANRIPLYGIGMLQYIAPIIQFGLGVFVFHEPMPAARWIGFGLVWLALAVFSVEGFWAVRNQRATATTSTTVAGAVPEVAVLGD